MTTILFDFFDWLIRLGDCNQIEDNIKNNNRRREWSDKDKKLFTIQYTKEELNKIEHDLLRQITNYFAKIGPAEEDDNIIAKELNNGQKSGKEKI